MLYIEYIASMNEVEFNAFKKKMGALFGEETILGKKGMGNHSSCCSIYPNIFYIWCKISQTRRYYYVQNGIWLIKKHK